uniref:YL1_C domain-containing protein n=1 Tax=Panagrellus redivivus TaxID=6233 RepID=A0A7E4WAH1_PANRE
MPEAATSPTLPTEPSAARKSRRRRGPKKSKGSKSPPNSPANNSTSTTSTVNSADGKTSPAISPKKSQSSHSNAQSSHSNGNGRRRGQRHNAAGDAPNNAGANEFADMDFSHLNFNEPPPAVVSELPNGYGVSIVGTRSATGEITTRMKYDRQLMLALSHSPYALAHPDGYPIVATEMDELIPVFPRRYIPREYMPPVDPLPEPNPANGA